MLMSAFSHASGNEGQYKDLKRNISFALCLLVNLAFDNVMANSLLSVSSQFQGINVQTSCDLTWI